MADHIKTLLKVSIVSIENSHSLFAKGKVVDFADHAFEEGLLYIRVRFADKTELCWRVSSSTLIEEAGLSELPRPKGTGSNDNEGNHATQHRR
jgi:hypothetical protein